MQSHFRNYAAAMAALSMLASPCFLSKINAEAPPLIGDAIKARFAKQPGIAGKVWSAWGSPVAHDKRGTQSDGSVWWAASDDPGKIFRVGKDEPRRWLGEECHKAGGELAQTMPYKSDQKDTDFVDPVSQKIYHISGRMMLVWGWRLDSPHVPIRSDTSFRYDSDYLGLFICRTVTGTPIWYVAVTEAVEVYNGIFVRANVIDFSPKTMLSIRAIDSNAIQQAGAIIDLEIRERAQQQADLEARRETHDENQAYFQSHIALGQDTNCGLVIGINGPLIEVQVPATIHLPNGASRTFINRNQIDVPGGYICKYK